MIPHFERDGHRYTLPGIGEVPSVTTVLSAEGLLPDYSGLDPWYAERGTAIHEALALHYRGDLDWTSLHPEIIDFVYRGVDFGERWGLDPIAVELRMGDPVRGYAGTCDGLFRSNKLDCLLIPDWKTLSAEPGHKIQVVAYRALLELAAGEGHVDATEEEVRGARLGIVTLGSPKAQIQWAADSLADRRRLLSVFHAAVIVHRHKLLHPTRRSR